MTRTVKIFVNRQILVLDADNFKSDIGKYYFQKVDKIFILEIVKALCRTLALIGYKCLGKV